MTCSHCVASVTEEVSALDGVDSVSVDLQVGGASRIMVVSDRPIRADQVRDAVTEAGYTMADSEESDRGESRHWRHDFCASCATRIERKLNRIDGVTVTVNYATEKARVTSDEWEHPR